jgi:hypothetical protein
LSIATSAFSTLASSFAPRPSVCKDL